MSETNAPQPTPAASACAEVFDSTIQPAQGQVSQDQGPGPDNREGPMHTGEMNGVDPFFFLQFIALTNFVWDVSMSPGQLVFEIPIHPSFVHQFMAHICKMYNAFVGGFDFAISVAGTGFHAGKLLAVRLPPNIKPSSLHTIADITAFPYMVIDPKTLEVIVKSAMDQRNILYHYLPYNAENFNSFGGYLAIYVLLPLNTSATGATSISVQIFSRPARDFMFTQLRPIESGIVNVYKPEEIERALDFRTTKTGPAFASNIQTMTAYTATDVRELNKETWNAVKFNREPMNGKLFERFAEQPILVSSRFDSTGLKSLHCGVRVDTIAPNNRMWFFGEGENKQFYVSWNKIRDTDTETEQSYIPQFLAKDCLLTFIAPVATVPSKRPITVPGVLRKKLPSDPLELGDYVFSGYFTDLPLEVNLEKSDTIDATGIDLLIQRKELTGVSFFLEDPEFDMSSEPYAPPIDESVVTFQTNLGDTCQPHELKEAILESQLEKSFKKSDSLVFELIDDVVDLPLIPLKLHYNGYFTTIAVKKNVVYKFSDPKRYYLRYVGTIPETTPMVGGRLPISSAATYYRNATISRLAM